MHAYLQSMSSFRYINHVIIYGNHICEYEIISWNQAEEQSCIEQATKYRSLAEEPYSGFSSGIHFLSYRC